MKEARVKIAVVINFITTYREAFYKELIAKGNVDLTVYCHVPPPELNLRSIHQKFENNVEILNGKFFWGEKVVFSCLPWKRLLNEYDVVYIEGNPRYIAFAALATFLEARKKSVVLWTMVHSYRNAKLGHFLRVLWYRFFRKLLVYTEKEVTYLKSLGFKSNVVAINNAIDTTEIFRLKSVFLPEQLADWQRLKGLEDQIVILSCARLEPKNKFDMVIFALAKIVEAFPSVLWCVIGEGAEHEYLLQLAKEAGVEKNVRFLGAIYTESELAPWFMSARFLVHPGAIGLTLLHAYAYGVPVVTHNDERTHGPEFAAFVGDESGCLFIKESQDDLTRAMLALLGGEVTAQEVGDRACQRVVAEYDMRGMVRRFLSLASRA